MEDFFCTFVQFLFKNIKKMKYPCEKCVLRAQYEKNPKSLVGRFWRWQINFCPSWRGYFKSLPPEKQQELRKRYDFWKY
jgi:hypothetical protein